jgi:RNA 2',3'-cyclic 3'-phosphodiesterase
MRLFIAIELPETCKKELGRLRAPEIPGARWVPAEQIHLTLAFLGEVDEETSKRLISRLNLIEAQGFELCLAGTGCFPDRRRPRVLWVGVRKEPLLADLATKIHDTVLACDIPQEERPFSPHLTLARLKFPAAAEAGAFLDKHSTFELEPFPVAEFILFQSRLSPKGAEHIPLKSFPVAGRRR